MWRGGFRGMYVFNFSSSFSSFNVDFAYISYFDFDFDFDFHHFNYLYI